MKNSSLTSYGSRSSKYSNKTWFIRLNPILRGRTNRPWCFSPANKSWRGILQVSTPQQFPQRHHLLSLPNASGSAEGSCSGGTLRFYCCGTVLPNKGLTKTHGDHKPPKDPGCGIPDPNGRNLWLFLMGGDPDHHLRILESWGPILQVRCAESKPLVLQIAPYGCFLKWWYPTTMAFPTKNDHFWLFWGYHHLRKHPYYFQGLFEILLRPSS